jgi:hypothetical protein
MGSAMNEYREKWDKCRRRTHLKHHVAITPVLMALLFLGGSVSGAGVNLQIVAQTGDPVPGGNGFITNPNFPSINNAGFVAFESNLSGTSGFGADDYTLLRTNGLVAVELARKGQIVPNGNGKLSSFLSSPLALNDAGQVSFYATLSHTSGGTLDNGGVYRTDGNTLVEIARQGQVVPGGNGRLRTFDHPTINASGQVSFQSLLTDTTGGTTDDAGIFRGDGSNFVTIAREGASTGRTGESFSNVAFDTGALNDAGQVAFRARVTGGSSGSHDGIFRGDGINLVHVARGGEPAPGTSGTYGGFSVASLTSDGHAVFVASVNSDDAGTYGIFRGDEMGTSAILLGGQAAPGGGFFYDFVTTGGPAANDANQVAFRSSLAASSGGALSSEMAIFRTDGVHTVRIAARNSNHPEETGTFRGLGEPALNDAGQVAFQAEFNGEQGIYEGIYLYDDNAGVIEIARTGAALLGSTIRSLAFASGYGKGEIDGLNDQGQIAFGIQLVDMRTLIAIATLPDVNDLTPGDTDFDGDIDLSDLGTLATYYGQSDSVFGWVNGDFDNDNDVDLNDLGSLATHYGRGSNQAYADFQALTSVPEPAGGVLVLTGLSAIRRRRRSSS